MGYNEKSRKNLEGGRNLTPERARTMQRKSAEQRKSNRLARELLTDALTDKDRKREGMERLADLYAKGDLSAIKLAQDILGENKVVVDLEQPFVVNVSNKRTAELVERILNGECD